MHTDSSSKLKDRLCTAKEFLEANDKLLRSQIDGKRNWLPNGFMTYFT